MDKRLNGGAIYVEKHHVLPRSLGGSDEPSNLINVLPEEHLILHMLRFHLWHTSSDLHAVQHMTMRGNGSRDLSSSWNKRYKRARLWYSNRNKGVHHPLYGTSRPESVRRAISAARKGTMPVKDAVTGLMIGSVSVDHPNVKNRSWVHHSSGRSPSSETKAIYSKCTTLDKNPRWLGITDNEILNLAQEFWYSECNQTDWYPYKWKQFLAEKNVKLPASFSKNRFHGKNFFEAVADHLAIDVQILKKHRYHKTIEHRQKLSRTGKKNAEN